MTHQAIPLVHGHHGLHIICEAVLGMLSTHSFLRWTVFCGSCITAAPDGLTVERNGRLLNMVEILKYAKRLALLTSNNLELLKVIEGNLVIFSVVPKNIKGYP
jgi:hypothetical protein